MTRRISIRKKRFSVEQMIGVLPMLILYILAAMDIV